MYKHFQKLLVFQTQKNPEFVSLLEEEVDIIIHKLKFVAADLRPNVLLISDIRQWSQDFSGLTRESVEIAGGKYMSSEEFLSADKLIIVQESAIVYSDLPHLLIQDSFAEVSAIKNNEVYIIQKDDFGQNENEYLVDLEILAEIIQPNYFVFGREGVDWLRFGL